MQRWHHGDRVRTPRGSEDETVYTTFRRWGSGSYFLENVVPPIDAIKSYIGGSTVVASSLSNDINAAVAAARGKDVAIVFANA